MHLSLGADIILLQEAYLTDALQEILQEKNLYWNFNSAFKYKGVETGVLTASILPPLYSCGLRTPEPIIRVPKTILINTYEITGSSTPLLVANIHGINITLGTGSFKKQMNELQKILEQHCGPIILAGDFNNWSKARTAIMSELVRSISLQVLTFDDEQRITFFGTPVDHILYRGLNPVDYKVSPLTSSDHYPISVTFRLKQTQPETERHVW
jgi:endonuclease/exonuclease/phosphatase (EEP) superfamily protein YafD